MNWVAYHVASGEAFFTGAALLLLAAGVAMAPNRWLVRLAPLCGIVGVLAIAVSATPLPYWYYALGAGAVVAWMVAVRSNRATPRHRLAAAGLLVAVLVVALGMELPYHLTPAIGPDSGSTIVIFGDSISAGLGQNEGETWPGILARTRSVTVQDYSQAGATVSTALSKAQQVPIPDGVIVLEIGGNDLLGGRTADQFEQDLDALLAYLSQPGRPIVMFELPLPPLSNSFGRAQRSLAAKYGVALIPKRILMRVLTSENATLDSIHLSQHGHRMMADSVWDILKASLSQNATP